MTAVDPADVANGPPWLHDLDSEVGNVGDGVYEYPDGHIACKVPECDRAFVDKRGPYAFLCETHKREKIDVMVAKRTKPPVIVKPPEFDDGGPRSIDSEPLPGFQANATEYRVVELARRVAETAEAVWRAREEHDRAVAALREEVATL